MTLHLIRASLGISQVELDRRAGVARGTTQDIESGRNKNPSLSVCLKLTQAIKRSGARAVKVEELFQGVA